MIKSHLLYQLSYRSGKAGIASSSGKRKGYAILLGMRKFSWVCTGLLALQSVLITAPGFQPMARATSFLERPFAETVKDSPVIVRGKIAQTYADWGHGQDTHQRVYTYWELRVTELIKGSASGAGGMLIMREMGGEKDGVGMQISGTARFSKDEDVVVFLSDKNGEGNHDVWGMMMGKLIVQRDAQGEETLAGPAINSLTASQIRDEHEGHGDTRPAPKWTLEALRRLVASQGDAPSSAANLPIKPEVAASSAPSPTDDPTPSQAASQLQPSSPERPFEEPLDSGQPDRARVVWGLVAAVLVAILVFIVKKRG